MSIRGSKTGTSLTKVEKRPANVSPDDVKARLIEREKLDATDKRTEAQRWLGDPPAWRSALAQRDRQ